MLLLRADLGLDEGDLQVDLANFTFTANKGVPETLDIKRSDATEPPRMLVNHGL